MYSFLSKTLPSFFGFATSSTLLSLAIFEKTKIDPNSNQEEIDDNILYNSFSVIFAILLNYETYRKIQDNSRSDLATAIYSIATSFLYIHNIFQYSSNQAVTTTLNIFGCSMSLLKLKDLYDNLGTDNTGELPLTTIEILNIPTTNITNESEILNPAPQGPAEVLEARILL